MSPSGMQGQLLDVTVIACKKLKDTELFSRQDPYVRLEYANSKYRTSTCTDGGKNPTFDEKFQIPLIEGLREIEIAVWNSNTFSRDDFIGTGRVQLDKVLSQGYDDSFWPIQTRDRRSAGEVRLIMHYSGASAYPPPPAAQPACYPPPAAQPACYPPPAAQPPCYPPSAAQPPYYPPSAAQPPYYPPSAAQPPYYPPSAAQPPYPPPGLYPRIYPPQY